MINCYVRIRFHKYDVKKVITKKYSVLTSMAYSLITFLKLFQLFLINSLIFKGFILLYQTKKLYLTKNL